MEDRRSKDNSRREEALARKAMDNPYLKEMIDAAADRPEEVCIVFCLGTQLLS
jgi:U3 small nucleolar ribonucleoprotein protein LCP5